VEIEFAWESDALRVIRRIPDITPCLIEGPNGIGKTNAVRLLALLSGENLIADVAEWSDFRRAAIESAISVRLRLANDQLLEADFTAERWPDRWIASAIDTVAHVKLNGNPVDTSRARELLWVGRLAGDEDLATAALSRVTEVGHVLAPASQLLADRREELRRLVAPLSELFAAGDPGRIPEHEAAVASAGQAASQASIRASAAAEKLALLSRAEAAAVALQDTTSGKDAWMRDRDDYVTRLDGLNDARANLLDRLSKLQSDLESTADAARNVERTQRQQQWREGRLKTTERERRRLRARLDLPAPPAEIDLAATFAEAEGRRADVESDLDELDMEGRLGALAGELSQTLSLGAHQGLEEAVVADLDGTAVRVGALASATGRRADELANKPDSDTVIELRLRAEAATRRLSQLARLQEMERETAEREAQIAELVAELASNEDELSRAQELAELYTDVNQQLGAVDQQIVDVTQELASLLSTGGRYSAISDADARRDLEEAVEELVGALSAVPTPDEIRAVIQTTHDDAESAEREVEATAHGLAIAEADLRQAIAESRRVLQHVREEDNFAWSRDIQPAWSDDEKQNLALLSDFARGVERAISEFERADKLVSTLAGTAARLGLGELRSQIDPPPFVRVLVGHAEAELREQLNHDSIRRALFGGREVVGVDLVEQTITADGEQARHFRSFSTGQRAFAYTQALVADTEPRSVPNRLLVLDEFGAFVASDLRDDLFDFLLSKAVSELATQVLLILPQQVDYRGDVEMTSGSLKVDYEGWVKQLDDDGYVARPLR
jgi:hypothetical protein